MPEYLNTSFLLQNKRCEYYNSHQQFQKVILQSKIVLNASFKDF